MADLRYKITKSKSGFFSDESRLYVSIEGLEEGAELTEAQALIVLIDQLDTTILDIKEDVHKIWKEV